MCTRWSDTSTSSTHSPARSASRSPTSTRELDVTPETIRRDLDALEKAGHVRRVTGRSAHPRSLAETTVLGRTERHTDAKRAVAQAALALVPPTFTGSILLDAGTTTEAPSPYVLALLGAGGQAVLLTCHELLPTRRCCTERVGTYLRIIGGRGRVDAAAAVRPP